jgi:hypothetical protein
MRTIPHYLSAAGPKSADKNSDKPDFSRPDKRADKCGHQAILVPIYLDSEYPQTRTGQGLAGFSL